MRRQVNTASEVIDELGGTTAVARAIKANDRAVSNWRVRGLPQDRYLDLAPLLDARRVKFSPELFGFTLDDLARLSAIVARLRKDMPRSRNGGAAQG